MSSKPTEIIGQQVTSIDKFWLDTGESLLKKSIPALEESAKQLIAITSILQTIFFAAVAFSTVQKIISSFNSLWKVSLSLIFIAPIVCWIVTIVFAIYVFTPQLYRTNLRSPTTNEKMFFQIAEKKHSSLQKAHLALLIGFIFLVADLFIYLTIVPPS